MTPPTPDPARPSPPPPPEDVYDVVPPEVKTFAARFDAPIVPEVVEEEDDDEPVRRPLLAKERFQFTIRDMLLLMTGVAVWLSIMSIISWSWAIVAGLAGVAAFIGLIVLLIAEPENPSVRFAWWCLLGIYAVTSLAAMVAGR